MHAVQIKQAVRAGLTAGLVFILLEMILVATIGGGSAWAPPRMIAAIVMGPGVLPPPASFAPGILLVALAVHFPLAIAYGLGLGWVISRMSLGAGAAAGLGLLFGLGIYLVNFYAFTAIWPWFAMARNGISVFAHLMFGLVLGWTYGKSRISAGIDPRPLAG